MKGVRYPEGRICEDFSVTYCKNTYKEKCRVPERDCRGRESGKAAICEKRMGVIDYEKLKIVGYIHAFGFYLGNYSTLSTEKNQRTLQSAE